MLSMIVFIYILTRSFFALYKGVIPKMLKLGPGMVCM